ncbi:regulator [Cryobacterium sp. BB736]|uniref:AAA family ATPase n=1 Tax=Cryobacterium sp. BB736 TaxID=2746963 RepID=UPI0018762366
MKKVAVALPAELQNWFVGELARHGYELVARVDDADALSAVLASSAPDFAIVAAALLDASLVAASDDAGVRMIVLTSTEAERTVVAGLGIREVVPATAAWPEIEALLVGAEQAPAPSHPVRGQVIAVWGPAGAPGRTSLAIGIAAELAAAGHSVALADADTHSGSVAPALGLLDEAPGFAAACRLAGTGALDRNELERVGQRYRSGHGSFWVLTGIGRASRWPELSAQRVVSVIAHCRDWVDYTVLDTGFSLENDEEISSDLFAPRRNAATISALREADRVIAVGAADPVGLSRFLRAHVDLVEMVDAERITVVMNKLRSSVIGLNPAGQVEQTLQRFGGISGAVMIPFDQAAFDAAMLSGRSLPDAVAKSPARTAIAKLVAARILPPERDGLRRRRARQRLERVP